MFLLQCHARLKKIVFDTTMFGKENKMEKFYRDRSSTRTMLVSIDKGFEHDCLSNNHIEVSAHLFVRTM